jgi:hypothetical protein
MVTAAFESRGATPDLSAMGFPVILPTRYYCIMRHYAETASQFFLRMAQLLGGKSD